MRRFAGIFLIWGLFFVFSATSFSGAEEWTPGTARFVPPLFLYGNTASGPLTGTAVSGLETNLDRWGTFEEPFSSLIESPPWRISSHFDTGTYGCSSPVASASQSAASIRDASYDLIMVYQAATWISPPQMTPERSSANGLSSDIRPGIWSLLPSTGELIGPIYIDGRLIQQARIFQSGLPLAPDTPDKVMRGMSAFVRGTYMMGTASMGSSFALLQDKALSGPGEGIFSGTHNTKPLLIFLNSDLNRSLGEIVLGGDIPLGNSSYNGAAAVNLFLQQSFIGWKTNPRLNFNLTFSLARLDQKLCGSLNDDFGRELDFTATYRIFDNLNFMAVFGYLWAGDALRNNGLHGSGLSNDWLLMHRLTINF